MRSVSQVLATFSEADAQQLVWEEAARLPPLASLAFEEPFCGSFLREALWALLEGDVPAVREAHVRTVQSLRTLTLPTLAVSSRVRLSKSSAAYLAARGSRKEFAYEALLSAGRAAWRVGERVRVYRAVGGGGGVVEEFDGEPVVGAHDPRDYDVEYYVALLRRIYAVKLARAFSPADFDVVFADVDQLPLFAPALAEIAVVLERVETV